MKYLLGECNYGGRITDENDRILMKTLIEDFFSEEVLNAEFRIGGQKEYKVLMKYCFDFFLNS